MANKTENTETQTENTGASEPQVKLIENQKALALQLHPDGIIVIPVDKVDRVGATLRGSRTCTVNGLIVNHTLEAVLFALGWAVSPPPAE